MKKLISGLCMLAIMAAFSLVACDDPNTTTEKAKADINQAAASTKAAFERESAELKRDIQAAQKRLDARLEKIGNDIENASDEAKAELKKEKAELEKQRKKLGNYFDNLGDDISDGWEKFKSNVRETLDDIDDEL